MYVPTYAHIPTAIDCNKLHLIFSSVQDKVCVKPRPFSYIIIRTELILITFILDRLFYYTKPAKSLYEWWVFKQTYIIAYFLRENDKTLQLLKSTLMIENVLFL